MQALSTVIKVLVSNRSIDLTNFPSIRTKDFCIWVHDLMSPCSVPLKLRGCMHLVTLVRLFLGSRPSCA